MKNKKLAGIVLAVLFISVSQGNALANEPDITAEIPAINNSETESTWNPEEGSYVISTVEDLKAFRESLNTGETYYRETEVNGQKSGKQTVVLLNNDIEIPAGADIGSIQKSVVGSLPITNFEGYFNGQGHTISGFSDTKVGLVDVLGTNGVITNLQMKVDLNFTDDSFHSWSNNYTSWESISYGVFSSYASGRVAYCSAEGNVNFDVDLSSPTASNGTRDVSFYGILENKTGGNTVYGWETVANCRTDFNYSVKAINGGEYTGAVVLSGIARNSSNRSSMQGSMTNCFATATFGDCSVTKPDGSAGIFSIYGIGSVKSKDFVTGCYFDKTDGHYTKTNDLGSVINPVTSTDDLTKAKTYEGYDFENVWTTNEDTTMPELRKDIPDEMLLPVIDDGGIKGDVNGDDKVDAKDVSELLQVLKGARILSREEKIRGDINNDDIIDKKDVFEIQQAIVGVDGLINTY
ncbi:dockerin type I repeat-containing protein [Eubacterium sp.]|uniref:dockerin type I repeat-containing protein n=1 Tax=Eubacterium sp. TaxID=142586 RepID=UPI0026DEB5F8|nr:dockerin type I repeat-containing protein [Eubacterium sp.]MDO5433609.1 dockerin type I repeat-containing protein [Eubacterium sp.]